MVDTFPAGGDPDGDNKADPGDTIRYTVTVSNTGDADAINTSFSMTEDTNAPFVAGSLKVGPRAVRDVFAAVGNTQLSGDIRANDVDIDGLTANNALVITAGTFATTAGGSITIAADGTFTYTPQTGDQNLTDSYVYTVTDGDGLVGTGVVVFNLGARVWYVDSTYAGVEDGSSAKPYNSLADITGASGSDAANDIIFIRERAGDYDGNLTLLNGQQLFGSGAGLVVNTVTINPAGANTTLTTTAAATDSITLANGNSVQGFTIGNTTGKKLFGNNFGTLTISNVTLQGSGAALDLTSGTANGTIDSLSSTAVIVDRAMTTPAAGGSGRTFWAV